MAEKQQAPAGKVAKTKSSMNWPIMVVCGVGLVFIIWVWVNNYRVTHAAASPAPVVSVK